MIIRGQSFDIPGALEDIENKLLSLNNYKNE